MATDVLENGGSPGFSAGASGWPVDTLSRATPTVTIGQRSLHLATCTVELIDTASGAVARVLVTEHASLVRETNRTHLLASWTVGRVSRAKCTNGANSQTFPKFHIEMVYRTLKNSRWIASVISH